MRVAYTRVSEGAFPWLPLLRVSVRGPAGALAIQMLVDSGSMETTLPESVLDQIGVVPTKEQCELVGVANQRLVGNVVEVEMVVANTRYVSRAISVPDELSTVPILGHRDFFLNFWVALDSMNRSFQVSPARRR